MKIFIGASTTIDIKPFSLAIKLYTGKPYGHIYIRYADHFTGQAMISESSHGEAHKMALSKWYLNNRIVEEYEIDVSEEMARVIFTNINNRLQTTYGELNAFGVPFYDLAEYLGSNFLMRLTTYIFADGIDSTICSESAAFTLRLLGIQFNRPNDFVRPDHVIGALAKAALTEDYIKKVII